MKRLCTTFLSVLTMFTAKAQTDASYFQAYLFNEEYSIYMRIDFVNQDVRIPGEDLYGPLPGYLGREKYTFCWPIVAADVKERKAIITMVNDYGSEDLTASLTQTDDSTYVLKQMDGSALKVPNKGKWLKLPKTLEFKKKRVR